MVRSSCTRETPRRSVCTGVRQRSARQYPPRRGLPPPSPSRRLPSRESAAATALTVSFDATANEVGGGVRDRVTQHLAAVAALVGAVAAATSCRPLDPRARTAARPPLPPPAAIVRGASTYGAYCAGCHGPTGAGDGPFVATLGVEPADLRAPALAASSDAALLDRLV